MEDSFNPLMEELKKRLDEETYLEAEKMFCDCYIDCTQYCAIESMKLAIGIMSGTYLHILKRFNQRIKVGETADLTSKTIHVIVRERRYR